MGVFQFTSKSLRLMRPAADTPRLTFPHGSRISSESSTSRATRRVVPRIVNSPATSRDPPPPSLICVERNVTVEWRFTSLSACRAGWSLAEIASSGENTFVSGLLGGAERWLGANDKAVEGTWVWESGPQFWAGGSTGGPVGGRFTNFVSGEPNNSGGTGAADCLRLVTTGQWRDVGCDSAFGGLCESDTGPSCADGIQNGSETGVDCGGGCPACFAGVCAEGKSEFGGHCYALLTSTQTYDAALRAARHEVRVGASPKSLLQARMRSSPLCSEGSITGWAATTRRPRAFGSGRAARSSGRAAALACRWVKGSPTS